MSGHGPLRWIAQRRRRASRRIMVRPRIHVQARVAVALLALVMATGVKRIDGTTITPAKIDATVTHLMEAAHVTGISVAILNDNRVVYVKSYGLANVEKQQPLRTDSIVWAASFTKSLFAYFVMQLVDEGVIELDTPIERYLPKPLPQYEKYADLANDERWKQITPRMLLSHTAGFPNFRFLNADGKLDIKFTPGSHYAYSGEGINLLQFVIEAKTGKSIAEMMQTRIFTPFGMTRSSMTWQPQFESDIAFGYDEQGKLIGHNKRTGSRAAGSMDTTIIDYAKFIEAVMQRRGVSAKSWKEMFRPQIEIFSKAQFPTLKPDFTDENHAIRLSYGLGVGLFKTKYGRAFFKEGHDDGWENHFLVYPDRKIGIVLMSNSSNGDSIFVPLMKELIGDRWTPARWEGYAGNK
ncbi:MAG: beta-lactamase [Acidobacteria bacterium]|nr:beta-lactamase [Acidobacteriota bacterium]